MSVNMLLISGAVKAGTSKTGKKIITAIASCLVIIVFLLIASLPSWERGLKYRLNFS